MRLRWLRVKSVQGGRAIPWQCLSRKGREKLFLLINAHAITLAHLFPQRDGLDFHGPQSYQRFDDIQLVPLRAQTLPSRAPQIKFPKFSRVSFVSLVPFRPLLRDLHEVLWVWPVVLRSAGSLRTCLTRQRTAPLGNFTSNKEWSISDGGCWILWRTFAEHIGFIRARERRRLHWRVPHSFFDKESFMEYCFEIVSDEIRVYESF